MSLEHHLCISSDGVPELDASVLGAAHNPVAIGSEADAEHKVLKHSRSVSFEI
jgi:hypothetical protein